MGCSENRQIVTVEDVLAQIQNVNDMDSDRGVRRTEVSVNCVIEHMRSLRKCFFAAIDSDRILVEIYFFWLKLRLFYQEIVWKCN